MAVQLNKFFYYLVFLWSAAFCINYSYAKFDPLSCKTALVENGHYASLEELEADPFTARALSEIERFEAGKTDAPGMTAELVARFNTYRIVPRNQIPIHQAKVVFVAIHGNGGGNSGPHSLSALLAEFVKMGIITEGEASKFYAEAPALPGAEAGPNRNNYQTPEEVVQWTIQYLRELRKQMGPDAKLVVFTRSSGADFGIKAALETADEGLINEVISMSPTTTGIRPEDKARLEAAEAGAIQDLQNNGSGINSSAFAWIMKMLNLSKAWEAFDFKRLIGITKFKFLDGSEDKQVPIIEREYTSDLTRESDGNLVMFDYFRALHDTFAIADNYDPQAQALPMLRNYIRQEYLGIPAPDAHINAETFKNAPVKTLGGKQSLGSSIPATPKTLVAAFEAGLRFETNDIHIVKIPKNSDSDFKSAVDHNKRVHHGKPAVYLLANPDSVNSFVRASGVPGFTQFRKGAKIHDLETQAKQNQLFIKRPDGSLEAVNKSDFTYNEVYNSGEIERLIQSERLVERQFQNGVAYYLPVYRSNFEVFQQSSRLSGEARKVFNSEHSKQENKFDAEGKPYPPQAKEGNLVNFDSSAQRGDILVLPEGMRHSSADPESIKINAQPLPPQRFNPIYFARFHELVEAAEKGKLLIVNPRGNITAINADSVREYIAKRVVDRMRAENMVKSTLKHAETAEQNGKGPTENILLVEGDNVQPLTYSQTQGFLNDPDLSTLTFQSDADSPASLRFHAWVKPLKQAILSAQGRISETYKRILSDNSFSVQENKNFWALMHTAKNEVNEEGVPMYDVHSWLLPQALFHEKNAHTIEITDGKGKVIAGAIILNKGDRWSIDALVDLSRSGPARREYTNAKDNPALQKAFVEAMELAFRLGAKRVEVDRIKAQIDDVFRTEIEEVSNVE